MENSLVGRHFVNAISILQLTVKMNPSVTNVSIYIVISRIAVYNQLLLLSKNHNKLHHISITHYHTINKFVKSTV